MTGENPLGFHRRWTRLRPPLRPDAQIVSAYRHAIAGAETKVLLLGVTAELADLGETLVAVDLSRKMIANAWPGDNDRRKAMHGNWLAMPLQMREFTAAIGDGVMTGIAKDQYATFFSELARLLLPGARFAVRLYETPEPGETVDQVREQTVAGHIKGFHAFKWRLAMALATETNDAAVPVARIHQAFQSAFPDRDALRAATGWTLDEIAEMDAYDGKPMIYQFHTRREFLAHLPPEFSNPRFLSSGEYELSERCPLFVADFHP
jgi:hypothetical protein